MNDFWLFLIFLAFVGQMILFIHVLSGGNWD